MTTPKTDLIDESTEPAGSTMDPPSVLSSADAQAMADARGQLPLAEAFARAPLPVAAEIRAQSIDVREAMLPTPASIPPEGHPAKWRGVRSKALAVKTVQAMARPGRLLYRNVLDWALGEPKTLLESKPRRTPEVK